MSAKTKKLIDAIHSINKASQLNNLVSPSDIKNSCIYLYQTENSSAFKVEEAIMTMLLRFLEPDDTLISLFEKVDNFINKFNRQIPYNTNESLLSLSMYGGSSAQSDYSMYSELKQLGFVQNGKITAPSFIGQEYIETCHDKAIYDYIREARPILEKGIDLQLSGQQLGCFQFPSYGKDFNVNSESLLYTVFKKHYNETERSYNTFYNKFNIDQVSKIALNTMLWDYLKSNYGITNISTTVDNGSVLFIVNYIKDSGLVTFSEMIDIVNGFNSTISEYLDSYFDSHLIDVIDKKFDLYYKQVFESNVDNIQTKE